MQSLLLAGIAVLGALAVLGTLIWVARRMRVDCPP